MPSVAQSYVTLWPCGLEPARLLCPWRFPGKNTRLGCHFLLHGILPMQGFNLSLLSLLHCRQIHYLWANKEPHVISGNHIENIMERNSLNNIIFETNITRRVEGLYETDRNFANDCTWYLDHAFSSTFFLDGKTRPCQNPVLGWALLSHFSHVWFFATPRTVAHQAPLSMGLSSKNTGVDCHALFCENTVSL